MDLKGKKILFLGDSITEGHGVSAEARRFTDLIAKSEGAICRNYGIGGTRIAYQQQPSPEPRWELNFIDRVAQMDADTDIVFVFGGTNDYGHGDAPMGSFNDRTPHTFYGAVHTLLTRLIERYPTARIVLATPLHREGEQQRIIKGGKPETVSLSRYVTALREVAAYYAVPVLDLYTTSGMQPEVPILKQTYMPDGLHPNDAGHVLLAKQIAAFLKTQGII